MDKRNVTARKIPKKEILATPEEFAQIPKPEGELRFPVIREYIDPQMLTLQNNWAWGPMIYYGEVPLWRTLYPLEAIDVFIPQPCQDSEGEDTEPYMLCCRDKFGDIFCYGQWDTLEDMVSWLKTPKALY